jgi:archaellum biogenesis ATPase FlaH
MMLCALLVSPEAFIPKSLGVGMTGDHFNNADRAWLFRLLVELHEAEDYETINGPDETGILLAAYIKKLGEAARMPPGALHELRNFQLSPHNGHWKRAWEALVAAKARRTGRKEIQILEETLSDGRADGDEILSAARDLTDKLAAELSSRTTGKGWREYWPEVIDHLENLLAGKSPGTLTNILPIDAVTGGMAPGELWVIGGQTSAGKSVLLLQLAWEAIKAGETVLVFTLEMGATEVILRVMAGLYGVDYAALTRGEGLTKSVIEAASRAGEDLKELNLIIDDSESVTTGKIQADCDKYQPRLVIVDYLQLLDGERQRNERQDEELGRNTKRLKQIAKRTNATVLTASQLNDKGKLFAARAIGHHCDTLFTIQKEGVRTDKNRNGRRGGLLPLKLSGARQRFQIYEQEV